MFTERRKKMKIIHSKRYRIQK